MMLALRDPREAYRRVEVDARVGGASQTELVGICYDQFAMALGSAIKAAQKGDNSAKSRWLTQALSALFALEMGVDQDAPMAGPLLQLYHSARNALLDSVTSFDADRLNMVRSDFIEIAEAMAKAR